ncbi:MAG: hypothetical protein QOH06_2446 [Acidobacteriota bacterium]|jgi:hypothetical protein|nr:hypothetical protein [Acidobacteriota bacterium]
MYKKTISVCFATSGTIIGLLSVKGLLPMSWENYLTGDAFTFLAVLGVGLLIVGVILFVARLIIERIELLTTRGISHSVAKPADLEDIRILAQRLYETEEVSPLPQMRAWLRKYPRAFFVVFTRTRPRLFQTVEELQGYFCLLPLSSIAAQKLCAGELRFKTLSADDLMPAGFSTIYLGGVAAIDKMSRGVCLDRLQTEIENLAALKPDAELLTRPVTKDGLRLVRSYGFRPIGTSTLAIGTLASISLSDVLRREGNRVQHPASGPSALRQATGELLGLYGMQLGARSAAENKPSDRSFNAENGSYCIQSAVWSHQAYMTLSEHPYCDGLAWSRRARECRSDQESGFMPVDIIRY